MEVPAGVRFQHRDGPIILALSTRTAPLPPPSVTGFLPAVSREDTSPKGDGSIRRYFCGEGPEGERGAHLLLFGEAAGLWRGSKSIVLLSVAPQAMS